MYVTDNAVYDAHKNDLNVFLNMLPQSNLLINKKSL
jgi:hypothetical protein